MSTTFTTLSVRRSNSSTVACSEGGRGGALLGTRDTSATVGRRLAAEGAARAAVAEAEARLSTSAVKTA